MANAPTTAPRPGAAAPAALAAELRQTLAHRCGLAPDDLRDDLPLAGPTLGLDSVAVVELVLECERLAGAELPADLLCGAPLTVGELFRRVVAAASQPAAT